MTGNESETSAIASGGGTGAEEELWLTYLNYDQSIQQAVRRLGALSTENVDLFRGLLLKSRDRSRVKEYEAESIRRLQGEAFVGDEDLQRTLIVLHAEEPRFGEELKRLVAATGKPVELDKAVADIRSGNSLRLVSRAPDPSPRQVVLDEPREAVIVPLRKEPLAPAPRITVREEARETRRNLKPLIAIGAVVLVAAVVLVVAMPGLFTGNKATDGQISTVRSAEKPPKVAAAPVVQQAPAADLAIQADKSASASPPLRPASTQPDAPVADSAAPQPEVASAPAAGSKYKVMRGDMLSDIALQVYGDASKFRLIQAANPGLRNRPDRILVDQVIFIPLDH